MSTILLEKLRIAVKKDNLLPTGAGVVVAVSGGPDSVALLQALDRLNRRDGFAWRLHVAHFNHRLRGPESDVDERFVRSLARRLVLGITVASATMPRRDHKASEDDLRSARYSFLHSVAAARRAQYVATGHTLDDQVETVLLHVGRGSSIRGLGAMRDKRALFAQAASKVAAAATCLTTSRQQVWLVRPLLGVSREEVLAHLRQVRTSFRQDSSNWDTRYTRNFVRSRVLPLLRELNPSVTRALADLAGSARDCCDFVDFAAAEAARFISPKHETNRTLIKVCDLMQFPPAVRSAVVETELKRLMSDEYTSAHRAAIESLIANTAGTKVVELPGNVRAKRVYGLLSLARLAKKQKKAVPETVELRVPGITHIPWAGLAVQARRLSALETGQVIKDMLARKGHAQDSQRRASEPTDADAGGDSHEPSRSRRPPEPSDNRIEYLDYRRLRRPLLVRTCRPGDRFRPLGQNRAKKLQDFFVDLKVPREERGNVPLLCACGEIVWVVGYRIGDRVKIGDRTRAVIRLATALGELRLDA